jgi:hypothetical protein
MEWLMVLGLGAAGGAGAYVANRVRVVRGERRERHEDLLAMRTLAEEDVTVFGEQLQRLGERVADRELDADTRLDYQTALDAYERAKFDAPRLDQVDQISSLVDTLATGRYAMTCVRARVAGQPLPELRVPCFFNPQHGPSARNVVWTSPRTGTRTVPACVRCDAQIAHREKPEVRMVRVGGRKVPYWEAGATYHPYSRGYFPADSAAAISLGWAFYVAEAGSSAGYGGGVFDGGYSFGDYGGYDGAGGDGGGGFDGGGGL